jgi:hypothetical protein
MNFIDLNTEAQRRNTEKLETPFFLPLSSVFSVFAAITPRPLQESSLCLGFSRRLKVHDTL